MQRLQKLTACLLAMVLLLSVVPCSAMTASAADTLYDTLYEGLMSTDDDIVVSSHQASLEEIRSTYQKLIFDNPELFFVEAAYEYRQNTSTHYVTNVYPTYSIVGGPLNDAHRALERQVNNVVAMIDEDWSAIEKILFVHDYFCQRFQYDMDLVIYDAYRLFETDSGVCQAYTHAMRAVLEKVGIATTWAYSKPMNHIWPVVQVDGEWYHADVTWNDATPDLTGRALHEELLLSDEAMLAAGYHDWVCDQTCTSDRFDEGAVWSTLQTPFAVLNDTWYYIKNRTLYSYDFESDESTTVRSLPYRWKAEGGYWPGFYSGLMGHEGKLYFNTPTDLCSYDPATDTLSEIFSLPAENGAFYGSFLRADPGKSEVKMKYMIASTPNGDDVSYGWFTLHAHEWDDGVETKPASCDEEGEMLYSCTECEETYTAPIPKTEHEWDDGVETKPVSCEEDGEMLFSCENCDETYTDPIVHQGHDWDDGVETKPVSCEEDGEMLFSCENCDETYTDPITHQGHDWGDWAAIDDKTEQRTCKNCSETDERDIEQTPSVLIGDVDKNGKINTTDARKLLQYAAGIITADALDIEAADVNADGKINTTDARGILRFAAGLITSFDKTA